MKGQRLLIGFNGTSGNLFHVKTLELKDFGLEGLVRCFEANATLEVLVLHVDELSQTLTVDITKYLPQPIPDLTIPEEIRTKLLPIQTVRFKNINTFKILKLAAGNRESKLTFSAEELTAEYLEKLFSEDTDHSDEISESLPGNSKEAIAQKKSEPLPLPVKYVKQKIRVPFKELRFIFGGVAFDYSFKPSADKVEVKIYNDVLREEFDAVRNYFRNLLKTKAILVFIEIEHRGPDILNIEAFSPEISRIKKEDIENVRFEFVSEMRKSKFFGEIDKTLFTPEEFFQQLDNMKKGASAFFDDPSALFDEIIGIKNAKHYKHLRYLSSIHAHDTMKLRFVLKPLSFIFLVKGNKRFHFVWETLDSEEATWIWHSGNNREELKRTLSKIEDILNVVKIQGKTAYINSNDDMFRRIIHDYSDVTEGFIKWKFELDSVLT
jgi:hypothetical protein